MYVTKTTIYCDGKNCGRTLKNLDDQPEEGKKIVIGCDGQNPPSVFFNYCPACDVPPVAEIAKLNPYLIVQKVQIRVGERWVTRWSGNIFYDSDEHQLIDDGDTAISEEVIKYGRWIM